VLLTALATALVAWFTIRLTIGAASDDDLAGPPGRR
jgi:hypothetical protein